VSVGFYAAHDYEPPVEFGAIGKGGSKSIILKAEHIDTRRLSAQDARFRLQWRRDRGSGRVPERCLPPINAEKLRHAEN